MFYLTLNMYLHFYLSFLTWWIKVAQLKGPWAPEHTVKYVEPGPYIFRCGMDLKAALIGKKWHPPLRHVAQISQPTSQAYQHEPHSSQGVKPGILLFLPSNQRLKQANSLSLSTPQFPVPKGYSQCGFWKPLNMFNCHWAGMGEAFII